MERKKRTPKEKINVVLEGLRGDISITEICRKYGITSTMYYKWRDIFIKKGEEIFANKGSFASERTYMEKIRSMERVIGRLAMENELLKKTENFL